MIITITNQEEIPGVLEILERHQVEEIVISCPVNKKQLALLHNPASQFKAPSVTSPKLNRISSTDIGAMYAHALAHKHGWFLPEESLHDEIPQEITAQEQHTPLPRGSQLFPNPVNQTSANNKARTLVLLADGLIAFAIAGLTAGTTGLILGLDPDKIMAIFIVSFLVETGNTIVPVERWSRAVINSALNLQAREPSMQ